MLIDGDDQNQDAPANDPQNDGDMGGGQIVDPAPDAGAPTTPDAPVEDEGDSAPDAPAPDAASSAPAEGGDENPMS